jgi:RNA polymerase sigma-70 factor (ECF subfamily)
MREPEGATYGAANLRDMALRGGDSAVDAFRTLWDGYYRRLSLFAAAYRGLPAADRHDAVADALIAAFGALPSFDPRRPLSPWVYRIAANRFSDAARRAARVSALSVGPAAEPEPFSVAAGGFPAGAAVIDPPAPGDHAAELADRDLAERCRAAIAALPESDRRIAMLRFYEGFSASDIGRALGVPAGTVRWRISAIRAAVRAATGEGTP